ncbi:ABC transporter substrate-binding protein [Aggregatilinea lenta]|uniref:ABC transporter substrate-binding protein n=1 Tax=Aggregatilinea lenta TaxID=913108 RepID=UPI000E5C3F6A|nr:sugar ABC transporter substrate-binding protein [Aggregatilinea lenta]
MKRLIVALVLVCALVVPMATGFAQDDDPRASDPFWNPTDELIQSWRVIDNVEEGAEITFWTMSLSPTFDEYINKIVENFELAYPEVTVNWEDQPWDSLQDKVRNSFAAGEAPDVININPTWIGEFAEADLLMNMDDALAAYPDVRDQYSDGAWTTSMYNDASYQIPWYLGLSNFLGYNTAILDELGVAPEDLPTTWTDLYDFCAMVREESDYYCTSLNFGGGIELNLLNYLVYNDVPVYNEDGTVALNTGSAVENLQLWADLVQNDLVPRESLTDDHRAMVERFSQGETAVIMIAPHMLRLVEEANPDVYAQLAVAPGITGTSGANATDVQSLVIPAATEYPNAALALATFVTNAETQAAFSKEAAIFPSNLGSYDDPFFQSVDPENPVSVVRPLAYDYVLNALNLRPTFPNDAEVQQVIIDAQNAALLAEKTPQEALDDMVAQINELIAEAE